MPDPVVSDIMLYVHVLVSGVVNTNLISSLLYIEKYVGLDPSICI